MQPQPAKRPANNSTPYDSHQTVPPVPRRQRTKPPHRSQREAASKQFRTTAASEAASKQFRPAADSEQFTQRSITSNIVNSSGRWHDRRLSDSASDQRSLVVCSKTISRPPRRSQRSSEQTIPTHISQRAIHPA